MITEMLGTTLLRRSRNVSRQTVSSVAPILRDGMAFRTSRLGVLRHVDILVHEFLGIHITAAGAEAEAGLTESLC